jgi:hypothetical protein
MPGRCESAASSGVEAGAENQRLLFELGGRNRAGGVAEFQAAEVFLTLIQPDGTFKPIDRL